jgi:hypothetical protein
MNPFPLFVPGSIITQYMWSRTNCGMPGSGSFRISFNIFPQFSSRLSSLSSSSPTAISGSETIATTISIAVALRIISPRIICEMLPLFAGGRIEKIDDLKDRI